MIEWHWIVLAIVAPIIVYVIVRVGSLGYFRSRSDYDNRIWQKGKQHGSKE